MTTIYSSRQVHQITIGKGCNHMSVVAHEIMHALGFMHEQSRPDRDSYVTVYLQNVKTKNRHNFNKYNWGQADTLRIPYDLGSIMHYGTTYFAKRSGLITMLPKDRSKKSIIGQRNGLSKYDALAINRLYKCRGTGGTTVTRGSCKDKVKCTNFSKSYCRRGNKYYSYMSDKCRKHCGFCSTTTTSCACRNKVAKCANYARQGFCKRGQKYYAFMSDKCKKTCRLCSCSG